MPRYLGFISKFYFLTLDALRDPVLLLLDRRDLLRLLMRREIANRTSGTALGGLWLVAQPALQIVALWFLLDVVLRIRFPGQVPLVSYLLIGMLPWLMLSDILQRNLNVLAEFGSLYQRAVFPIRLLPLVPSLMAGSIYGLVFTLVALMLEGASGAMGALIAVIVLMLWLLPYCYLFSVLGLFARDLGQLIPFALTLFMYLTPILYLPSALPDELRPLLVLNPFADVMVLIHALVQNMPWTLGNLLRPLILWLLTLAPCWWLFKRAEPHVREAL